MRRIGLAFALASLLPTTALPCAMVGSVLGHGTPLSVVKEDAVIVWDHESKIEHFIRKAQFNHPGQDFGFLVPTPTTPALAAAKEDAFRLLETVAKIPAPPPPSRGGGGFGGGGGLGNPVVVTQSKEVGRYQAVSLEAANVDALQAWLKRNGYASSRELMEWIAPYVKHRWTINAFKISRGGTDGSTEMTPVRLSFRTRRPFYPYREPKASGDARQLRLYVIAEGSVSGHLTDGLTEGGWIGPKKTMDFPGDQRAALAEGLGMTEPQFPEKPKLTVFDDFTVIREPKDVAFRLEGEKPAVSIFGFALATGVLGLSFAAFTRRRL